MHPSYRGARECVRERKAMQAAARSGKPAGYTWNLWHQPRKVRRIDMGPIRDWRYPSPAYKDGRAWADIDRASYDRCMEDWRNGTHPWCGTSVPETEAA